MPAVHQGSISCFIDGIYAAFVLAAVRIGLDAQERKHFAAFGIFCGLAMATKYPGLVALSESSRERYLAFLGAMWRRTPVGERRTGNDSGLRRRFTHAFEELDFPRQSDLSASRMGYVLSARKIFSD
jgi:hypothetical protein